MSCRSFAVACALLAAVALGAAAAVSVCAIAERPALSRGFVDGGVSDARLGNGLDASTHVAALVSGSGAAALLIFIVWTGQLRQREEHYRGLIENGADLIIAFEPSGSIRYHSPSCRAVLGRGGPDLVGQQVYELLHDADVPVLREAVDRLLGGGGTQCVVQRMSNPEGASRSFEAHVSVMPDGGGRQLVVLNARDITARLEAEERLRRSEERFQLALRASNVELWEYNFATGHSILPEMLYQTLGYGDGEGPALAVDLEYIHENDRAGVSDALLAHVDGRSQVFKADFRLRSRSGEYVWVSATGRMFDRDGDGEFETFIGIIRNVAWRKELEESLRTLATRDGLTGLHNRVHFISLAERELDRAGRYRHPCTVLMVDADDFKAVNDTYGHEAGDAVLCRLAETAVRMLRDVDIVGRIGGEEFAALLPETDVEAAVVAAERVRAAVDALAVETVAGTIRFTVSIGVATFGPQSASLEEMLRVADAALYKAKKEGRNRVVVA
ncbi:diguanylate cyclase (GGDEF)-like protein/PAS domain S-box-containing protein [Desulfobaculum xiamenense]|uniref:diguanylate cyclase n=1 Tax=Desulfobaculum xiamenense TaxID=995050 RepID=A0A846QSJ9_9BACT|nr:sensor domain-containing diguanylate cyclase [Desulfobaculum xiamenense]NJB69343.1 diguanylate cyclase (GGDEF)-like protein/PAS domain S-box-containing protein [Desulfobaculum xiamenense]